MSKETFSSVQLSETLIQPPEKIGATTEHRAKDRLRQFIATELKIDQELKENNVPSETQDHCRNQHWY
jgi:hypothetical protein